MTHPVKLLAKKLLASAGLELKKLENSNSEEACATRLLRKTSPQFLIDVGASIGQYSEKMLQIVPDIQVVSFEPLSDAHKKLSQAARKYPQWSVAERCAVGDKDGSIEINISNNSVSSSVLPMQSAHLDAAPESAYIGKESVPVRRLDSIVPQYLDKNQKAYLKIDTQGYEKNVLQGATGILENVVALQLELSFVELYAGQALAFDMIQFIRGLGFKLFALANGFADTASGELLQVDAFFIAKHSAD